MADGVTLEMRGVKEIENMFKQLPKQVAVNSVWVKFWRENSKPLKQAAQANAPLSKRGDVPHPRDPSVKVKKGTLKESIQFFTTKSSKKYLGGYIGPRVKGKFKKGKSGWFGAWVEYGGEVMHYGKFKSRNQPFMENAWESSHGKVLQTGFKDAEKIFSRVMKSHEKRMQKYGKLGY